jgi:hypothetical protein
MLLNSIFLTFLLFVTTVHGKERHYISGNGFRSLADYCVEDYTSAFNPASIPPKSVIYVETNFVEHFFEQIFPHITQPIILIVHNGDWPSPGKFASYLDDPRIVVWFTQNCNMGEHPKLYPIPIGIANAKWAHGNPRIFDEVLDALEQKKSHKKRMQLYINFSPGTNKVRPFLLQKFKNNPFAFITKPKQLKEYLLEMAKFQFVLSPHGNGLDCHRTWEALLVGAVPVVKKSTLDPLYQELPVIIVDDWTQVNEQYLKARLLEMQNRPFNYEKLFLEYWAKIIKSYKNS